jgi:hypothetical protein
MALKVPWKALSKGDTFSSLRDTFSSKRGAFFVAAGLFLVVGLVLRLGDYFGQPEVEQKAPITTTVPTPSAPATPAVQPAESIPKPQPAPETATPKPQPPAQETATAPNQQVEQTGEAVEQTEQAGQPELPDAGTILVSRRSVEVLSGPSASASSMYGFPAGRQFRVIGREGSFIQIKDVVSGASGWIDEAGLAPPPRMPDVSAPSQSRPAAGTRVTGPADPKPKATRKAGQATVPEAVAEQPVETRKRPGLFGGDGPFRGIFGN